MYQYYIITVGYSLSGKTTLIKKLDLVFKSYNFPIFYVDTRSIHDYLNKNYQIFQDDNSVNSKNYKLRQDATDGIQQALLKAMLDNGYNVLKDSCNLSLDDRQKQYQIVRKINSEIKIVMIYANPIEKDLIRNIQKCDTELIENKKAPVWLDLYEKQKKRINIPSKEEVDIFIEYNWQNYEEVEKKIINFISGE